MTQTFSHHKQITIEQQAQALENAREQQLNDD